MKIVSLSFLLFIVFNVQAEETWPRVIHTFTKQPQHIYKQNNFLIEIKPLPIPGRSGGRHYEVVIFKDSKILGSTITEAVFVFFVLDVNGGFPQLEAWSSGGAEEYVRLLYRWDGSKFSVARIDDYIKNMNGNNQKSYTPEWAKEYGFSLTYRSTRTPK